MQAIREVRMSSTSSASATSDLSGTVPAPGQWREMNRAKFEALVARALRKLPRDFREKIANVAVVVEDWADEATLAEMEIEPPDTLYGLYRGIDLTRRDAGYGNVLPDTIHIYQGPIEEDCADPEERWRR